TAVVGSGAEVMIPSFSKKPDHEVELAVVIGRRGKDIPATRAYDHIVGYTVVNDISLRDGSERGVTSTDLGRNWYKGKAADTCCPMGPFIVTKDEISNPYPLALKLRVNGETRQDGTTDDMIFKIPDLVASASEGVTLECGDVISTGTCSGVGFRHTGRPRGRMSTCSYTSGTRLRGRRVTERRGTSTSTSLRTTTICSTSTWRTIRTAPIATTTSAVARRERIR